MKTRITELFGIEHPIIQGGMVYNSGARLAAAVAEAGGLGLIGAGSMRGDHGPRPERTAFDLLRNGMVTVVASDAPSRTGHAVDLDATADVLERVLRRPRAEVTWMLDTGPQRIAAGEPVRAPRLVPLPRGAAD